MCARWRPSAVKPPQHEHLSSAHEVSNLITVAIRDNIKGVIMCYLMFYLFYHVTSSLESLTVTPRVRACEYSATELQPRYNLGWQGFSSKVMRPLKDSVKFSGCSKAHIFQNKKKHQKDVVFYVNIANFTPAAHRNPDTHARAHIFNL